jgi:hypothetical protein
MEKISAPRIIDWAALTLEQVKKLTEDTVVELKMMEAEATRQRLHDEREKKDNLLDGPVPSKEKLEAAQRAAERIGKTRDEISRLWSAGLENEMRQEAAILQSPQIDKDWQSFKDHCAKWNFPSLPAPPEAITAFLGQSRRQDVARLYRAIRTVHNAYYQHPCDDVLVRAVVREARQSRTKKPTSQTNGKAN